MAEPSTRWIPIAMLADFGTVRKLVRTVDGAELLLVRLGADVVAVDNRCSHLGQPLDRGRVMSGQITCPFHGACFDLRSGAALSGPAVSGLRCHAVLIEGDRVLVAI